MPDDTHPTFHRWQVLWESCLLTGILLRFISVHHQLWFDMLEGCATGRATVWEAGLQTVVHGGHNLPCRGGCSHIHMRTVPG